MVSDVMDERGESGGWYPPEIDERLLRGGTDLLGHLIEGDTFGTSDGAFIGIVRPRREDEETTGGNGIKEAGRGFEVLTESVVGEVDDMAIVMKEGMEHFLFIARDERRDHDRAFGGGIETGGFVVFEGLVVAMFGGIFDPHAADVDGLAELLHEDADITYSIVGATVDLDVMLNAEEAGFKALGSKAGGVHLDVADHGLELAVRGHGAEEGHFGKERRGERRIIFACNRRTLRGERPDSIRRNGRTLRERRIIFAWNRRTSFCGIGTTEFFGGLPETTYDGHDTIGHGALDMNDDMEMVGHKAELKDTYLRIVFMPMDDTLNEILAKLRLVDIRL